MPELAGRVALVTGAARVRGIGRAVAVALAAEGARVAVADRAEGGTANVGESERPDAAAGWRGLPSLVEEIERSGGEALALLGDVSDERDASRLVEETVRRFGRLDILVNNAAAPYDRDRALLWETPTDAFDLVIGVNLRGTFLMCKAAVPRLLEHAPSGRIVNIASTAGKAGKALSSAYSASKFGVIGLTEALSRELAPRGITVNAVCPGRTDTNRMEASRGPGLSAAEVELRKARLAHADGAVQRLGQPADIARVVRFLCLPHSDFISGQALNVDGGRESR